MSEREPGSASQTPQANGRECERVFFIPDAHIPFEDKRAVALVFDALTHYQPHTVVIMGDFLDCFSVSHWVKDPRRAFTLEKEIEKATGYLDRIDANRKIYVCGNHEDRLERYLKDKAPELLAFVDIPRLLGLKERGWEYVPYRSSTTLGKVHITHDVGSAGRYNVWKALDTFQASVVTGHTHRLGYVVEGNARGRRQVSAQFGWLGDITKVDYLHRVKAQREWALGFGYGLHDTHTGVVYLTPAPIVNYTVAIADQVLRR
jgi:predicted phosphodiesterase